MWRSPPAATFFLLRCRGTDNGGHAVYRLSRRDLLASAAAVTVPRGVAQPAPIPIIDTHIHFFDTTRPQGVPYGEGNPVGPIASPAVFRKAAARLGVVGAIE